MKMWKTIGPSLYSINFMEDGVLRIYVTDFIRLWHAYFNQENFIQELRNSNPSLSGSNDAVFLTKGKEILRNPEALVSVDITPTEDLLSLSIVKSYGYPFRIKLKLQTSSKEQFFKIVTNPLLKSVNDLKNSESELKQLLIKKDGEINKYKEENIQVLQYLKTPAFDEEKHKQKYKQYEATFGASEVPAHVLTKEVDCPEEHVKIEVHEAKVKTEPMDSTSQAQIESNAEVFPDMVKEEIKVENIKTEPLYNNGISPRKKKKKLNI